MVFFSLNWWCFHFKNNGWIESKKTRARGKRNHKSCTIVTMIGNILVIISVFTYTPLKITPNYFIVSLAMADLTVSACVLPFNIVHSVLGRWVSSLKVDKGQWISEAIFLVLIWTKKLTKLFFDFRHKDLK